MARPVVGRGWRNAVRRTSAGDSRHHGLALLLLILLLSLPLLAVAAQPESPSPAKRVLILNSYHPGYTWSDNEQAGILETLSSSGLGVETTVEYLDAKNFSDYRHFSRLRELLAVKYGSSRPDLIMVLDNPAFDFVITYRRDLFPGIPVVFVGLNEFTPAMLKGETGIAGIVERQDIAGTVTAALAIQPETKEVVIVHDYTTSGLASRDESRNQLTRFAGRLAFRYLPEMSIQEIVTELRKLNQGSIVLPFSFARDREGKVFTHAQLAQILSSNSPVPVYGTKVERLGHGIIGGSLLEGKSHGTTGAGIALRILRGERADALAVITDPPSTLIFDHAQLKRFRIDKERLPAGSSVINEPPGIYQQHGAVINVAGAIIAMLAISLGLVIAANRRRKLAEAALLESERTRAGELENANKEMESFCYAVSHDLQAPLRHINSFSSIVAEEYGEALDKEGRHYLSRIGAASLRMGQLIKDLLMLSQISREEMNRTAFDLGVLAREILEENYGNTVGNTVVEIEGGMTVSADRQLLRVVLDNLIGNALKYSSKGENPVIRIGRRSEYGKEVYFVSDNGVGFDMQYADKLFTPFQRLHEDSQFEGNGIGLATVQRVIHRHGGTVWAESAPGNGATFSFTLGS